MFKNVHTFTKLRHFRNNPINSSEVTCFSDRRGSMSREPTLGIHEG